MPRFQQGNISRAHLFSSTENKKLTLISAPAGFGKSTLLCEWANAMTLAKLSSCWLSIDNSNNTNYAFLLNFIYSLNQCDNADLSDILKLTKDNKDLAVSTVYIQLINALSQRETPLYFFIDGFENITDSAVLDNLNFFIKNMPENCHLIIASRTIPSLSVSKLRIAQQLHIIDEKQLAFTLSETTLFFESSFHFKPQLSVINSLNNSVLGWPYALGMVALLSKDQQSFQYQADQIAQSNHTYIWDYFNDEFFSALDQNMKDFLIQIAPLVKINATISNTLCEIADSQQKLMALSKLGAFIKPLDEQNKNFRLFTPFKNFLLNNPMHLVNASSYSLENNHKKISNILIQHGDYDYALPHAIAANDLDLVSRCLQESGWYLFHNGHFAILEQALELLNEALWDTPDFVLLKAWILQGQEQSHKVDPLLQEAEYYFAVNNIKLSELMKAKFIVLHAQVSINSGQIHRAIAQAKTVLKIVKGDNPRLGMVAQSIIAEGYHGLGNLLLAEKHFEEVVQLATKSHVYQSLIWALYQQAEISYTQAEFIKSYKLIKQVLQLCTTHNIKHLPLYTFPLLFRAQDLYLRGNLSEIPRLTNKILTIIEPYGEQSSLYAKSLQIITLLDLNKMQAARDILDDIGHLLNKYHYHLDWISIANQAQVKFWVLNNDPKSIKTWLITAPRAKNAFNRIDQRCNTNLIQALIFLENYSLAKELVIKNIEDATQCNLKVNLNMNLIMLSILNVKLKEIAIAQDVFLEAISLSFETQIIMPFVKSAEDLKPIYQSLLDVPSLKVLEKEKIERLVELSQLKLETKIQSPFDAKTVAKIRDSRDAPIFVKNIPLTGREWQVLGLIHLNMKNHEIAEEMQVAPTTIKSHIRNVYQKLGLENRKHAKVMCVTLLDLI